MDMEMKNEGKSQRQIRVDGDIADMLAWIEHFERTEGNGDTIAQIVKPWLEAPTIDRYSKVKKRAEEAARALGIKFRPGTVPPAPGRKKRQ